MSVWRVCERAELGQVGRHWELAKDQPLSVGRSADSHIQVQVLKLQLSSLHTPQGLSLSVRWALFREIIYSPCSPSRSSTVMRYWNGAQRWLPT